MHYNIEGRFCQVKNLQIRIDPGILIGTTVGDGTASPARLKSTLTGARPLRHDYTLISFSAASASSFFLKKSQPRVKPIYRNMETTPMAMTAIMA